MDLNFAYDDRGAGTLVSTTLTIVREKIRFCTDSLGVCNVPFGKMFDFNFWG